MQKLDWLRHQIEQKIDIQPVKAGASVPVEGRLRWVQPAAGRKVVLCEDQIQVPGSVDQLGVKLRGYLRALARDRLAAASDGYAAQLGRDYHRLTLRDTRSRWGSCSSQGALMYSWRLIMAPPDVLQYVAAHEIAHLSEMNHAPAFWALVGDLYGDYAPARSWLKENGAGLHNFRFGD